MERGAWAELYFMVLAMSQGLRVSSPYGGFGPYDVGVEGVGPILRVQVKCTMCRHRKGGYSLSVRGPRLLGYPRGTVDFFALYIIPTDDWYIIPYAVIGEKNTTLYFTPQGKRQKYGRYQEAWHLLLNATKGRRKQGTEIRACIEDGDAAGASREGEDAQAARGTLRVRRMFRGLFER
jgi:hypothetical protein